MPKWLSGKGFVIVGRMVSSASAAADRRDTEDFPCRCIEVDCLEMIRFTTRPISYTLGDKLDRAACLNGIYQHMPIVRSIRTIAQNNEAQAIQGIPYRTP